MTDQREPTAAATPGFPLSGAPEPVVPPVAAAAPEITPVSPGYARYALWLLLAIYTLNFLDRQILNILMEDIKAEFDLADWQLGALGGLAFATLYTTLGIPIARLAERRSRPAIIAGSIAVWSGFTALCGAATSFWTLFLYRVGVGMGEAGCTPPAHSLISDYVPKERRASAIAFYSIGTPLGTVIGLIFGGFMADTLGWRTAFMLAGAPGVVMAILAFFTLREPRKTVAKSAHVGPSLMDALRILRSKKTFWLIAFAAAIKALIGYGHAPFGISFFLREHAADLQALAASAGMGVRTFLGLCLGVAGGIAGVFGAWFGGVLSDRLGAKDIRAYAIVPCIASIITVPVYCTAVSLPTPLPAILLLTIPAFLGTLWYGPVYGTAQSLVPPQVRATAAAVILFTINLIGLGLGPLLVGIISDVGREYFLAQGLVEARAVAEGLRWSLILSTVLGLGAALLFYLASRTIRDEMVS